jgi:hypothetical protein
VWATQESIRNNTVFPLLTISVRRKTTISTTDYLHTSRRSRCGDSGFVTDSGVSQSFLKIVTIFTLHGDRGVEIAVLLRIVAFRKTY